MITVDDREDDEVKKFFPKTLIRVKRMQFADYRIIGNGESGVPETIGIERKKIRDMVNSITDERFSGLQLPGLMKSYQRVYLIVEGYWRENGNGYIEVLAGKKWKVLRYGTRSFYAEEVKGFLETLRIKAGVYVLSTVTPKHTAQTVLGIHRWWTSKTYEEHMSHIGVYNPHTVEMLSTASYVKQIASVLPHIGIKKAALVEAKFETVRGMINAKISDWVTVDGIGSKIASDIVSAITTKHRKGK